MLGKAPEDNPSAPEKASLDANRTARRRPRPGVKTAAQVPAMAPLGAAVEDYCQPLAYYVSCYFKCYKHNRVYLNKLSGSLLKKRPVVNCVKCDDFGRRTGLKAR